MGFYDCRCMITGLSLIASKTVLILLEKWEDRYVPISLPVLGQYNRLGSIDMIDETQNTKAILDFFQAKIATWEVMIDWEEVYWEGEALKRISNIEQLFASVERSVTMEYDCVTLNDRRIEFSLIDARIWTEIIQFKPRNNSLQLAHSDTWNAIYKQPFSDYQNLLHQFQHAQAFMDQHNIEWTPSTDSSQDYDDEVRAYLEEAKSKFKDEPLVMKGILQYEDALED